ncbi:DNA-binding transcriptional regulator LsrR (DeoR family) [Ciceribacter lividus]|uniref:DNA-binding transcriptional regulator LsrR (DeoR family) n=1 Tax=Ciceribacter lividus TaxID=1197950 RepID=A0A6I7HMH6_9HYPH|nr:sugar-binding transcriptional regulator [Ciceribacter lividus]RCW24149.1 DNA-binding transcriptional regulator LsrR (DeoR family) [Ciceribacter lividus]
MARRSEGQTRLDDAARAGWLYYVAGRTQDEIAAAMGISRQSAQRLVSLSVAEKLIKVRLDHPIAACMELAEALKDKFGLKQVEVVPSDGGGDSATVGVAEAGAAELERWLKQSEPLIIGMGTGRTLRAVIDQLSPMECPQHKIVSLTGNISPDGSAAYFNVIFSMADAVKAPHFPMPLPVLVSSRAERDLLRSQPLVAPTIELGSTADVTFVGIGHMGLDAPLLLDGFLKRPEMEALLGTGATGEICGWVFGADGNLLDDPVNERVASISIPSRESSTVIGLARGRRKHAAIRAAVVGGHVNGLITDEETAHYLLKTTAAP